jgi:hypothetical protein
MAISGISSNTNDSYAISAGGASNSGTGSATPSSGSQTLTDEQKQQVEELKKRDAHVRAHEAAHAAAGGQYVRGGPSYSYQNGPDGKRYAVGGEVSIDASPVAGDPAATISKMEVVKRAALAPGDPSGADQAVAAEATSAELKAEQELMKKRSASGTGTSTGDTAAEKQIKDKKSTTFVFPKAYANTYIMNSNRSRNSSIIPAKAAIDVSA